MASIYTRGNVIWIKFRFNGGIIRESLSLPNTPEGWEEAEIQKLEREADIKRRRIAIKSKQPYLSDAFDKFLEYKIKRVKNITNYDCAYKSFTEFYKKNLPVNELTENDFIDYKNYLIKKKKYNTIVNYFNHLREFFIYLKSRKEIDSIPVPKIKYIDVPIVVIKDDHMKMIYEYLEKLKTKENDNILYYRFIKFLRESGFRRNEALNLKWEDISFERKIIDVWNQKENRFDVFPLLKKLEKLLLSFRKDSGPVFPISPRALVFFPRMIKKLKLPPKYTIKSLRSTFGSNMAKKVLPYKLMKLMRHKNIQTTMKYYILVELEGIIDEID